MKAAIPLASVVTVEGTLPPSEFGGVRIVSGVPGRLPPSVKAATAVATAFAVLGQLPAVAVVVGMRTPSSAVASREPFAFQSSEQ